MSAFVDTSALYALLVRTEHGHGDVTKLFRRLLADGRPLWTTSYVLVETWALLQHRFGLEAVRDLNEQIVPVLSIEWVSQALHHKAASRLLRANRRDLSLVDCVSFEFMSAEGLGEAMALDRHFAEAGFKVFP